VRIFGSATGLPAEGTVAELGGKLDDADVGEELLTVAGIRVDPSLVVGADIKDGLAFIGLTVIFLRRRRLVSGAHSVGVGSVDRLRGMTWPQGGGDVCSINRGLAADLFTGRPCRATPSGFSSLISSSDPGADEGNMGKGNLL